MSYYFDCLPTITWRNPRHCNIRCYGCKKFKDAVMLVLTPKKRLCLYIATLLVKAWSTLFEFWDTLVLEVLNMKARSSTNKTSKTLIFVTKNSCLNVSFLSGLRLENGMSTLHIWVNGMVCSVLWSFDFCGYEALFWHSLYLITIVLDLTWLNIVLNVVVNSKLVKYLTSYSQASCSNLKKSRW